MNVSPNPGWTDERIARMKELWLAGWSFSKIAADLGHATRSSVAGKFRRLHIRREGKTLNAFRYPVARKAVKAAKPKAPPIDRKIRVAANAVGAARERAMKPPKPEPIKYHTFDRSVSHGEREAHIAAIALNPRPWADLKRGMCCAPIGEGDTMMACCNPVREARPGESTPSYCLEPELEFKFAPVFALAGGVAIPM